MTKRFLNLIGESLQLSLKDQYEYIKKSVNDWKGNEEQIDDVLVLSVGL
jgi:hypothetical protein